MTEQTIGRADYELRAKLDTLRKDLAQAKGELASTGAAAEKDFTQRSSKWGPALATGFKAGVKVVGAATAGVLAIATKGALELEDIQNRYQADTGATAEEAKRVGKVINQVAGENQQSLEAVAEAAAAVHNDLGAVGDEGDKLLAQFTKFARVTKQEPVAAVKAFDDILDAWGLTAADSDAIMDKLIVSHQKYGGSIGENEAALAKMAPQLKALNASFDDGVALLNLFAASGLDAQQALGALNFAVKNLKPGETLDDLVAQVSSIEDPTKRAEKAIEKFGARGGVAMSNALKPGINSLGAFAVSTDEVTGATDKAAEALDEGFGPSLRKKLSEAGAAIRGLGADWGPVLTGASTLASALTAIAGPEIIKKFGAMMAAAGRQGGEALVDAAGTATGALGTVIGNNISSRIENIFAPGETALGKVWRRIAASSVVRRAAALAGAVTGAIYGAASAAGAKIAEFLAPVWRGLATRLRGPVLAAGLATGVTFGTGVATGASGPQSLAAMRTSGTKLGSVMGLAMKASIVVGVAGLAEAIEPEVHKAARTVHDELMKFNLPLPNIDYKGWHDNLPWPLGPKDAPDWARLGSDAEAGGRVIAHSWGEGAQAKTKEELLALIATFGAGGRSATAALAGGLASGKAKLEGAYAVLAGSAAHFGANARRIAHQAGLRAAEAVAQGIHEKRQAPVDAFEQLKEMLKHPLTKMKEQSRLLGELTSKALAKGLRSKDPEIRAHATATKQAIIDRLEELKTGSHRLSKRQAELVAAGLKSKDPDIRAAANRIKHYVQDPLVKLASQSRGWGENVTAHYAAGIRAKAYLVTDAAGHITSIVRDYMKVSSPSKLGALSKGGGPEGWGRRFGTLYATGVADGAKNVSRAFDVLGNLAPPSPAVRAAMTGLSGAAIAPAQTPAASRSSSLVVNGGIHLHGVGSDVSPARAQRFGEQVADAAADFLQRQGARRGLRAVARP